MLPFKSETIPISAVGANVTRVQQMLDRVGFITPSQSTPHRARHMPGFFVRSRSVHRGS